MDKIIKNMNHSEAMMLASTVQYLEGQIVSKTLCQNKNHSLTLFAFDKGEEISSHDSEGDAMVVCLDGTGKITIDGKEHILKSGETIVMPAGIPHAVFAEEKFKMMLIVMFN